jgi:hypothetical protein
MTVRAHHLVTIFLVTTMVGADTSSCSGGPNMSDPNNVYVPGTNYCYTDPPAGCYAYCVDVQAVGFSNECYGVGQGPLEMQFEQKVQTYVSNLPPALLDSFCPQASNTGSYHVTPCQQGITPVEYPNQDHGTCVPVPAGCPW